MTKFEIDPNLDLVNRLFEVRKQLQNLIKTFEEEEERQRAELRELEDLKRAIMDAREHVPGKLIVWRNIKKRIDEERRG